MVEMESIVLIIRPSSILGVSHSLPFPTSKTCRTRRLQHRHREAKIYTQRMGRQVQRFCSAIGQVPEVNVIEKMPVLVIDYDQDWHHYDS